MPITTPDEPFDPPFVSATIDFKDGSTTTVSLSESVAWTETLRLTVSRAPSSEADPEVYSIDLTTTELSALLAGILAHDQQYGGTGVFDEDVAL